MTKRTKFTESHDSAARSQRESAASENRSDLLLKMYHATEFRRDDNELGLKERLLDIRKMLWELEPELK